MALLPFVPPMSPADALVNHGIDFSDLLAPSGTLVSVSVSATPGTMTATAATVGDGKRASCLAQFKLSASVAGSYIVTATVTDSAGETLARSITVPVLGNV